MNKLKNICKFGNKRKKKREKITLPNREELSLRKVLALPNASSNGFESKITDFTYLFFEEIETMREKQNNRKKTRKKN